MADHVRLTDRRWDVKLYGPPNKVLAGILMGDRLAAIVSDYTVKVAETYKSMLGPRTTTKGDKTVHLIDTVSAYMNPNDGFKKDRWVGVVSVGDAQLPYGAADEYGRNRYAPYSGRNDLEDALRMHLPHKI